MSVDSTSDPESTEYDLESLVTVQVNALRTGRLLTKVLAGLLTLAGAVALALYFFPLPPLRHQSLTGLLGAATVLLFVSGFAWVVSTRPPPSARRLVVSNKALVFVSVPAGNEISLKWDDPEFFLRIYDRRRLPKFHRDGTPRNPFATETRAGLLTPIPEAAFSAILREVKAHNLTLNEREFSGRGLPGSYKVILIRGHGSPRGRIPFT
jgi:hypothetical protein